MVWRSPRSLREGGARHICRSSAPNPAWFASKPPRTPIISNSRNQERLAVKSATNLPYPCAAHTIRRCTGTATKAHGGPTCRYRLCLSLANYGRLARSRRSPTSTGSCGLHGVRTRGAAAMNGPPKCKRTGPRSRAKVGLEAVSDTWSPDVALVQSSLPRLSPLLSSLQDAAPTVRPG
jgi:hypothetical protein